MLSEDLILLNPSSIYQRIQTKKCLMLSEINSKHYLMLIEISAQSNTKNIINGFNSNTILCYYTNHYFILGYS